MTSTSTLNSNNTGSNNTKSTLLRVGKIILFLAGIAAIACIAPQLAIILAASLLFVFCVKSAVQEVSEFFKKPSPAPESSLNAPIDGGNGISGDRGNQMPLTA